MPKGDRTGPMGMGPMTGRGAGFCAGFEAPGYMNTPAGYRVGSGRGRGFRRMFYFTGMPGRVRYNYFGYNDVNTTGVDEKEILGNQAEFLEKQLQQVKKRLKELNNQTQ